MYDRKKIRSAQNVTDLSFFCSDKDYQSLLMEAYVEEVRKLEEHFDGLQTDHVPHAENNIADQLSKCAAQKLPVEP